MLEILKINISDSVFRFFECATSDGIYNFDFSNILNNLLTFDIFNFLLNSQLANILLQSYLLFGGICLISKATLGRLKTLEFASELLLVNLTFLLLMPVLIALFLLMIIIRFFINTYLRLRFNGKVRLINRVDSAWSSDIPLSTNYCHVFSVIEGQMTLGHLQKKISNALRFTELMDCKGYRRLKSKIKTKFGFFCWEVDDKFNIENHVKYLCPENLGAINQHEVLFQVQKNWDSPMPEDKARWEFLLVPLYKDPENETKDHFAIVWKLNHSYMDGISGLNIVNWFMCDDPVTLGIDPFKPFDISRLQWILIYMKMIFLGPHAFVKAMFVKDQHSFHGPKATGPKTMAMSRAVSLKTLNVIKKKNPGSSITSLLFCGLGGGLKRFALKKNFKVPEEIIAAVTSAIFPYSLKPANRFALASMPIKIGLDDINSRIQSHAESLTELSQSVEFFVSFKLMALFGLLPVAFLNWLHHQPQMTLVLSNIPGLKEKSYINGQLMKEACCWNVIKGYTALGVCFLSHQGRIRGGFVGDAAIFSDPTDISSLIEEYENEMIELAQFSGVVPPTSIFCDSE